MKKSPLFFVGTYNKKGDLFPNASGKGLVSCRLDTTSGSIQRRDHYTDVVNPTYLAMSPVNDVLFAASDHYSEPGEVVAFSFNRNGKLQYLSKEDAKGTYTCHVESDSEGKRVYVASYMNGLLTSHAFDGSKLMPASDVISYKGSGPNTERQERAHAHQALISPDGNWLCVCDLGSDKIWVHDLDEMTKDLTNVKSIEVPAGYGPRHLTWNQELSIAYLFCELNAKVLTYSWHSDTGDMTLLRESNTLPDEYQGMPSGAAIRLHPSNKALFVSNRGHDSIGVFDINNEDGIPELWSHFSTEGEGPRDFNIDPTGNWLLAANQDSNTIVPFRLDPTTGRPTGETADPFECGTPVCILCDRRKQY